MQVLVKHRVLYVLAKHQDTKGFKTIQNSICEQWRPWNLVPEQEMVYSMFPELLIVILGAPTKQKD